jgi:galactokinase
MPDSPLLDLAAKDYSTQFEQPARWAAMAPGRVNLIGEHTDYNDGFVLPMAIERQVAIVAGPADGGVQLYSCELGEQATVELNGAVEKGEPSWTNYVRGVIAGFQQRGVEVPPFAAAIASDVPIGGGLSSSAALEVATATLLEQITGHRLDPLEKALLCQWAEHNYAGMPCGLMDQYVAVMGREGRLVLLDCQDQTSRLVKFDDPSVAVLIANTNVKHELTGGEYAERRGQCEEAAKTLGVPSLREATAEALRAANDKLDPTAVRRARHVISEIARTTEAAGLIEQGDWPAVGKLMYESHESLRDDFEVSCAELDAMVEAARGIGPAGGVQRGAGLLPRRSRPDLVAGRLLVDRRQHLHRAVRRHVRQGGRLARHGDRLYEWMAAVTLVFVAFWFLPKFLKSGLYTIPEFLEYRYDGVRPPR